MFSLTPYTSNRNEMRTYNPFKDLEKFEREFFGSNQIAEFKTDIVDNGNAYQLEADLPGFKKEDININIDGDMLTIQAKRNSEHDEKDKKGNYVYRERSFGTYSRSFDINGINAEDISAAYNDGVLMLTMPKKAPDQPTTRRLEIK